MKIAKSSIERAAAAGIHAAKTTGRKTGSRKCLLQLILIFSVICFFSTGCRSMDDTGSYENRTEESSSLPNPLERQGLAFSRILCSPLNMLGFTVAECKNMGGASVILFPFICCWTIPAGAIAMSGDVITGTFEMLVWQQFKSVRYPWDSFNYEAAKPYCDVSKTLLLVALAGAADGASQYTADSASSRYASHSGSHASCSSSSHSSHSGSRIRPRVMHSSCHGTGRCNICKGKGYVGANKRCICGGSGICRACRD